MAICKLGYIYNYEQILAALVQKHLPSKYSYIRKLTDIKKVLVSITKVTIEKASSES